MIPRVDAKSSETSYMIEINKGCHHTRDMKKPGLAQKSVQKTERGCAAGASSSPKRVAAVAPRGASRIGKLRPGVIQMEMPAVSMSDSNVPAKVRMTCTMCRHEQTPNRHLVIPMLLGQEALDRHSMNRISSKQSHK